MRFIFILPILLTLGCAKLSVVDTTPVSITINSGHDGNEVWVGVIIDDEDNVTNKWFSSSESEFRIRVPVDQSARTIVLLKKNAVPILQSLTPELITDGLSVVFSKGGTVTGNIAERKDGTPIIDGVVSLHFDEKLGVQLPEEVSIFSWEVKDDGTFTVHGVPLGDHTLEVRTPGYFLAEELVNVSQLNLQPEREILMEQECYVMGRIIKYERNISPDLVFRGEIDVELDSSDKQIEVFSVEFDTDDNFRIGPFARDSVINLQAWIPDGRRSKKTEVVAPSQDVELLVHHWVRVTGKVQDKDTGMPLEEYAVTARIYPPHLSEISDPSGEFSVVMSEYAYDLNIEAPGYLLWTTVDLSKNFEDGASYDLGTIELEPAHTVRGRVVSRATGEPIAGASVRRTDGGAPDWNMHTQWMRRLNFNLVQTRTDTNGEFELEGFPLRNGEISAGASGFTSSKRQTVDDPNVSLEIALDPRVSISGQVVSLKGEPVAARIVTQGSSLTETEDGNFHMESYGSKQIFWAISDSGRSKVVEVEPDVGEDVEGIRLVIDRVARVRGNISGLWEGETVSVSTDGASDRGKSNGPYEIVGVAGGFHDIRAYTSFGRVLTGSISIGTSLQDRFDFEFPSAASLSGRVTAGSKGFGEYQIVARPRTERYPVRMKKTESDGSYRFEDLVPDRYEIEIPSRAFTRRVNVDGDKRVDFDVGASELKGTVRSTNSLNNRYVLIKGDVDDRKITAWTRIMEDGSYRFRGLPQGTYVVRVTHPDYQTHSQSVNVNSKRVSFDIELN